MSDSNIFSRRTALLRISALAIGAYAIPTIMTISTAHAEKGSSGGNDTSGGNDDSGNDTSGGDDDSGNDTSGGDDDSGNDTSGGNDDSGNDTSGSSPAGKTGKSTGKSTVQKRKRKR